MIKQIGFTLCGHPILLITCMITDRIRLHSVLLHQINLQFKLDNWRSDSGLFQRQAGGYVLNLQFNALVPGEAFKFSFYRLIIILNLNHCIKDVL